MNDAPRTFEEALDRILGEMRAVMIERQRKYGCVTPGHRVLTADLRWVPVESLKVGDRLLAVDEHRVGRHRRRWRFTTVLSTGITSAEVCRIYLENGDVLTATPDHPWLTGVLGQCWVKTSNLRYRNHRTVLPKFITPWEPALSYEAGWLAGFFDGEGYITTAQRASGEKSPWLCGLQVAAAQKVGPVVEQALDFLNKFGFECKVKPYNRGNLVKIPINGGTAEVLRFLGMIRPRRLLERFMQLEVLPDIRRGRGRGQNPLVLRIEPAGVQEIVTLETESATYIVEGYVSHNSTNILRLGMRGVLDRAMHDKMERLRRYYDREDLRARCREAGMPQEVIDRYLPPLAGDYADEALDDAHIDAANYVGVIALMLRRGWWGLPMEEELRDGEAERRAA